MRILLDACLPRKLQTVIAKNLNGHEITSAKQVGVNLFPDRLILDAAEGQFDVILTVDRNLRHQQAIKRRSLAIVVLRAHSNKLEHLVRLVPDIRRLLPILKPGEVYEVGPV